MNATIKLVAGSKYDVDSLELVGWANGDEATDSTYSVYDYFAPDGTYLGADEHGVEPIVCEIDAK
jgi:hypothetical protein